MNKNPEPTTSIARLRLKVATNHFKRVLLGDLNVPGKAQASTVLDALTGQQEKDGFTERTWQKWYANPPIIPKLKKIKALDALAASAKLAPTKRGFSPEALPAETFSKMVHGGLVRHMLAPTDSKQPLHTLIARAENYHPLTPLHLHLDAIEIDALTDGFKGLPWETTKAVGARRILKLIAERWGPRQGSVYAQLSSNLRVIWEAANPEQRTKIRESYARFRPDVFEITLNNKASPNWSKIGVDDDVSPLHIYKVLFALAADTEFLVADRLAAWSLDLATSALAMHALAWTDRYTTFDNLPMADEEIFWIAFDEMLFTSEPLDPDNTEIIRAMDRCSAEWSIDSFQVFLRGRTTYNSDLSDLGVSASEVLGVAMQATKVHRMIYRG